MASWTIISRLFSASCLLGAIIILYNIATAIRDIYFHPLSQIPGPKLWIALPLTKLIQAVKGTSDEQIRAYHEQYGTVLRTGPNEVTFISAEAWHDIYGHRRNFEMPKTQGPEPGQPPNIINATPEAHARIRKLTVNGFSDRALRDQEQLIQKYVGMLIAAIREDANNERPVNVVDYFNFTTFDIIGDLSFGKSFDGLKNLSLHEWISNLLKMLETIPLVRGISQYPALMWMLKKLSMTKKAMQARNYLQNFGRDCVRARIQDEALQGRPDFINAMVQHKGSPDEIPEDEIVANSLMFIMAGSETTATLLTGLVYWLLRTPKALASATQEVRAAFHSEEDITIANAADPNRLSYLHACIEETFRIYPPAVTSFFRRTTLPTTTIAGIAVPAGTNVGVHHSAAYWSELNFTRPREFLPERFFKENKENPQSEFYHDNRDVLQPFSFGPRNCIGRNLALAEIRVIIARILYNFDMLFDLDMNEMDWERQKVFLVWQKKPLWVRFEVREDAA